jgi:hypothetical protein
MCLQPLLVEIVDNDQTSFLPLYFILDISLLTHESIQWAKESQQDTIFLKLDFSKVHDRVDFVYVQSYGEVRDANSFINLIRLLCHDASIRININNEVIKHFELHNFVCQGWPLAPYLLTRWMIFARKLLLRED